MTEAKLDEVIKRYTNNAEYVRQHGDLAGCMEFRELAEFLEDCKKLLITCEDAVSRKAVINAIKKYANMLWEKYREPFPESTILELIQALPSVQPTTQLCEDAVSRSEAIRIASGYCHPSNIAKELENLPSVQPETDLSAYSDKLWKEAYERGKAERPKPEITEEGQEYCKDCIHAEMCSWYGTVGCEWVQI